MKSRTALRTSPAICRIVSTADGCPDEKLEFIGDRLVVDERVLFDYDKATLKPEGQRELQTDSVPV